MNTGYQDPSGGVIEGLEIRVRFRIWGFRAYILGIV